MNETENNNLVTRANLISETDVVMGTISARNDVDCFKVNFRNNGRVTFKLAIPTTVNYRIRIFNSAADNAPCVGENVSTAIGTMRTVSVDVDTAHTYYIVISPNTTGLYTADYKYSLRMTYESRTIDIPANRICNWNQFYTAITARIGEEGCGWTCLLDVANIYGPSSYEPSDMPDSAWSSSDGVVWRNVPSGCVASVIDTNKTYDSDSKYCTAIRTEIQNNRPVIVKEYSNTYGSTHYVVAYGYVGTGDSFDKIKVYDPAHSKTDEDRKKKEGRYTTLSESMTFSSKDTVQRLVLLGNR